MIGAQLLVLLVVGAALVHGQEVMVPQFVDGNDPPTYANPDDYGYRYCAHWKRVDGKTLYSDCDPYEFTRCGKILDYEYHCCTGFKPVSTNIFQGMGVGGNRPKCARSVSQWKSCPEILKGKVGYSVFGDLLNFGNFAKPAMESHTIFAPYTDNQNELTEAYTRQENANDNPLLYHVVKNRFYASDLKDGMTLTSMYKDAKLKVTKYSFGVICIECVELMDADLECSTGVVHFLSKALTAPTGVGGIDQTSLLRLLETNDDTKDYAASLPADIREKLGNANSAQWYTVFVPKKSYWAEVTAKYSGEQLATIARNHVVEGMHCSAGLIRNTGRMPTMSKDYLVVDCSISDNGNGRTEDRYITDMCGNKHLLSTLDMSAPNGVAHVVDGALVPLCVMSTLDVMKKCADKFNIKKFVNLMQECDLMKQENKLYASLIPVDYSFNWWMNYTQFKPEYDRFQRDKEYRCRVARYHITAYNDQLAKLETLGHSMKGFRTNNPDELYETDYFLKDGPRSQLYFHYSPVVGFESVKTADGSFFRINRINVIPEKLIVDVVEEHPKLGRTSEMVKSTNMNKTTFAPNRPLNLFLATADEGYLDDSGKERPIIKTYENSMAKFLLLHHVPLYLWGGDIGYFKNGSVHRFMSSAGLELIFWRNEDGVMKIGYEGLSKDKWAEVIQWNLHAKDGIVWVLKNFLLCPTTICAVKKLDVDLYDVWVSACMYMELGGANRKKAYTKTPLEISEQYPDACVKFREDTYEVIKKISFDRHKEGSL